MQHLGYAAKNNYNRYCYEEASPVSNLFLNLKYMIERDGKVEENPYFDTKWSYGNVYLLENNAYLPLGFLAEPELADMDFSISNNNFQLQNKLFRDATGVLDNVWSFLPNSCLTIVPNNTNMVSQSSSGHSSYQNKSAATYLHYNYLIDQEGFLCFDMNLSARNSFKVYKNGVELYSESISLPQMFSVCQVAAGDEIRVELTCKANENGTINIRAGLLNEDVFRQGYDILTASTLELTEFSNTYVAGTIQCNRDGLLYTSIPQNGNWTATVDGQAAEIVLVDNAMICLRLTEGSHEISFTYRNKAFDLGWKISLLCLLIFGIICAVVYREKWKPLVEKLRK